MRARVMQTARVSDRLMARHVPPGVPTVLLVQDRPDDRTMYAEYLQLRRFALIELNTTDEALRRAADADVIVTGVQVSGPFDGLELVRRLRADARDPIETNHCADAWALHPSRDEALAAGCDIFLPKPCLPETLESEIRRGLARRRRSRPAKRRS